MQRKIFAAIILFFFQMNVGFAQNDQSMYKNSAYDIMKIANNSFDNGDYAGALPLYKNAYNEDKNDPKIELRFGICLVNTERNCLKGIKHLKNTLQYGNFIANYHIAKGFHFLLQADSAINYYEIFKKSATNYEIKKYDIDRSISNALVMKEMINNKTDIEITNPGTSINSENPEYAPVINAIGTSIYYTSRRSDTKGGGKDVGDRYFEDIYSSQFDNKEWDVAVNAGSPINSKEHDAVVAISADGSFMILYRTDIYTGEGDLYFSEKKGTEWTVPVKLGMNINSPSDESSASISLDMQTLYFSSNRNGGYGGMDLYKSTRKKSGVWGAAQNLGPKINTTYDEDSPFIYADGKTLYFSSKGNEKNMGGFDIFKSKLNDSDTWSEPANLGYPVNSPSDDLFFVLSADGKQGFFSSSRKGTLGFQDIFIANLKSDSSNLTLFKGTVLDDQEKPLKAKIIVYEKNTGTVVGRYNSNEENGDFLVVFSSHKEFKIQFNYSNLQSIEIIPATESFKFRLIDKEIKLTNY